MAHAPAVGGEAGQDIGLGMHPTTRQLGMKQPWLAAAAGIQVRGWKIHLWLAAAAAEELVRTAGFDMNLTPGDGLAQRLGGQVHGQRVGGHGGDEHACKSRV